jgi:hypothetical protein
LSDYRISPQSILPTLQAMLRTAMLRHGAAEQGAVSILTAVTS